MKFFDTKFVGPIKLKGCIFSRLGEKQDLKDIPNFVLSLQPLVHTVYKSRFNVIYEDEQVIYGIDPDFSLLKKFDDFIIVTLNQDSK